MFHLLKNVYKQDGFVEYCALFFQVVILVMAVCFDVIDKQAERAVNSYDNCNANIYYTFDSEQIPSRRIFLKYIIAETASYSSTALSTTGSTTLVGKDQAGIFLSILATIFTIHIALWALISGTLDKEYMGIYYAEYIFNMKPRIYTQKRIMLSSFGFLGVAYACYIFTYYSVVSALLLCEIISIAMSTKFIYGIFKNQEAIKDEIYSYSLEKHFEYDEEQDVER